MWKCGRGTFLPASTPGLRSSLSNHCEISGNWEIEESPEKSTGNTLVGGKVVMFGLLTVCGNPWPDRNIRGSHAVTHDVTSSGLG